MKCAQELPVINARKLPGMDAGSTSKKLWLLLLNKIVVPAK
jgi:hypothetical protein